MVIRACKRWLLYRRCGLARTLLTRAVPLGKGEEAGRGNSWSVGRPVAGVRSLQVRVGVDQAGR